jgi:hypothetical protein
MADPLHTSPVIPPPDPSKGADVYAELDTGFSRYMFFFPLNGTLLLPSHHAAINALANELASGRYFEIYALADRTGSQQVNYQVAKARYNAVENGLYQEGFVDDPANFMNTEKIFGEDFWEYRYNATQNPVFRDGSANAMFRCVVVYVWTDFDTSRTVHADQPLIVYGRMTGQPAV